MAPSSIGFGNPPDRNPPPTAGGVTGVFSGVAPFREREGLVPQRPREASRQSLQGRGRDQTELSTCRDR